MILVVLTLGSNKDTPLVIAAYWSLVPSWGRCLTLRPPRAKPLEEPPRDELCPLRVVSLGLVKVEPARESGSSAVLSQRISSLPQNTPSGLLKVAWASSILHGDRDFALKT